VRPDPSWVVRAAPAPTSLETPIKTIADFFRAAWRLGQTLPHIAGVISGPGGWPDTGHPGYQLELSALNP
jgi:hypothetical protein